MARTKQALTDGIRMNDIIGAGILTKVVPGTVVSSVLEKNNQHTIRERKLSKEFLIYYVIGMALFSNINIRSVLKALLESLSYIFPDIIKEAACESAISQGRSRLGDSVMKDLFESVCVPLSTPSTKGSTYRDLNLVAIDGSSADLPDEQDICKSFPKHNNGVEYPYPQLKFVALVELGTRCVFSAALGNDNDSEHVLAEQVIPSLKPGMLVLADRLYMCYNLFSKADKTGAAVVFRAKSAFNLIPVEQFDDGSYTARIFDRHIDRRKGKLVRVIEYTIKANGKKTDEVYRLVTNILDPEKAPASELAELYCRRWGMETAFDEIKDHLKLPSHSFRSKRADLVKQEFWGFLIAHYIIRYIIFQAASANNISPNDISFQGTINIVKRRSASALPFPPEHK